MSTPAYDPKMPLWQARQIVREQAAQGGGHCMACDQWAEEYTRQVNQGMAQDLYAMYVAFGTDWGKPKQVTNPKAREWSKLRYWGLIEVDPKNKTRGRVTDKGVSFMRGEITICQYAYTYNNEVVNFSGPQVTYSDCLQQPFVLDENRRSVA